jgi:predicted dehydrogenase
MEMKKINRVGIVGCGRVAEHHHKFLPGRADVEIAALVDKNINQAYQLGNKYGIQKAFSSLDELFNSSPVDVLHILTPPEYHFEQAREAIEKGIHVLIEKPMTLSL